MKNKILSAIIFIVLMISLVGCQQNNTIIKPYVETKKVTENSQLDLVTFTFESPDSWTTVAADKDSLICRSPSSNESEEYKNYISQDYLVISNYTTNDILPVSDEYKQGYEDLFKGTYDGIEKIISDSIEHINISKYLDSLPDGETGSKYSFSDLLNILSDPDSFPDYEIPDSLRNKTWASDFKYTEYQGKDGKIITVEYSYLVDDITHKAINCYRDDNYSVCGAFDDSNEISSGDVALWVANTLEVSEHYKIDDGAVLIEGKDY